jgi:prepilin-type N-terminal cleavage/methylation domain-containing protein
VVGEMGEGGKLMLKRIGRVLNEKGFTLIEIMIVVTIIAILMTIAFFQLKYYHQKASNSAAMSDLRNVETLLQGYYSEYKNYP